MKDLLGALLKSQQEFPALVTDATNPAYRSRYATLSAVQEVAFPVLFKHGLVVLQSVRTELTDKGLIVYVGATLHHVESGEETFQELGMLPARQDPQGIGSAITYGRRYLLMTMLGLVADDDDGNAASRAPFPAQQTQPAPKVAANGAGRPVRALRESAPAATIASRSPAVERPDWKSKDDAIAWSVEVGAFDDQEAARTDMRRIMQTLFPGRDSVKKDDLPDVLDAWFVEVDRRLSATPPA